MVRETLQTIFEALERAAEAGDPCPGNRALADMLGYRSTSSIAALVAEIERRGLIAVERTRTSRVVTIIASGKSTASTLLGPNSYGRPRPASLTPQARKAGAPARGRGRLAVMPLRNFPAPRQCEWPHGTPGEPGFRFCGAPSDAGKPYCAKHCARAYTKKQEPDADAA